MDLDDKNHVYLMVCIYEWELFDADPWLGEFKLQLHLVWYWIRPDWISELKWAEPLMNCVASPVALSLSLFLWESGRSSSQP